MSGVFVRCHRRWMKERRAWRKYKRRQLAAGLPFGAVLCYQSDGEMITEAIYLFLPRGQSLTPEQVTAIGKWLNTQPMPNRSKAYIWPHCVFLDFDCYREENRINPVLADALAEALYRGVCRHIEEGNEQHQAAIARLLGRPRPRHS